MSTCWLIEITPRSEELDRLRHLGMVAFETTSWWYLSRRTLAFRSLLDKSGVVEHVPGGAFHVTSLPMEPGISTGRQITDIQDYFRRLIDESLGRVGISTIRESDLPDVLALNLMPFYPRAAIADRAVQGVCRAIQQAPKLSRTSLLLLVRTHLEYSRNSELKRMVQSECSPRRAVIIDRDGFCVSIEHNEGGAEREPRIEETRIPRSFFEEILGLDEDAFRRVLVYQTNMNIGHFDIGTSHIRTHYDLTDFVARDNAFEHLYSRFSSIMGDSTSIALITTGLERKALTVLANRLESWSAGYPCSVLDRPETRRVVRWIGHFTREEVCSRSIEVRDHVRDSDCILVVTDIVNSGSTVLGLRESLESLLPDLKGTPGQSEIGIRIRTFAVAKMSNSPVEIPAAVTIRRPYFSKAREECPLCLLGQPIRKVTPENWEQDFRYVDPAQLTPLDFWEMVQDCDALRKEETYSGGHRLTHRVDTRRLVERYSHWLANVVRARYSDAWGGDLPDVIVAVGEEPGLGFADLVGRAILSHRYRIIGIPRSVLDGLQDPSEALVNDLRGCREKERSALLVDDGVNLGGTARKLHRFIQEHGVTVLGMMVLDSRLSQTDLEKSEIVSTKHRFVALYTWPSYPVEAL